MAQPVSVIFDPQAQEMGGLTSTYQTVSGLGLVSFGFLWEAQAIWDVCENPVTTVWAPCTGDPDLGG